MCAHPYIRYCISFPALSQGCPLFTEPTEASTLKTLLSQKIVAEPPQSQVSPGDSFQ